MKMCIHTASRLHFGLLSLAGQEGAHASNNVERVWGSVGLMIQHPRLELVAEPHPHWHAEGTGASRILPFVQKFLHRVGSHCDKITPFRFEVIQSIPEHQGFGSGTQLALAVARMLAEVHHLPNKSSTFLAPIVGRGKRSGIGIHGFQQGGFFGGSRQKHSTKHCSSDCPCRFSPILAYLANYSCQTEWLTWTKGTASI